MSYKIKFHKQALKDFEKVKQTKTLYENVKRLIVLLSENPYQMPPPYEKLVGNLSGLFSRRINLQHRLIYDVNDNENTVRIFIMWTHYE